MNKLEAAPLILTLKLDRESFAFFDALRRAHFPPERNFLSAHVTLFHHLPGNHVEDIETDLREVCRRYQTFSLRFPALRFLGRGTAIEVESAELNRLRGELKNKWDEWLNAQDRQKFKPHVTVQNKVAPDAAHRLFDELSADWTARSGAGVGVELWRYLNGPWQPVKEFNFQASD